MDKQIRPFILLIASMLAINILQGCSDHISGDATQERVANAISSLDIVMSQADEIDATKRHKLDSLKRQLNLSLQPRERYRHLEALFTEYRSYAIDTLLDISRMCEAEAIKMADDSLLYNAYIMEAESHKGMGDYAKALSTLDRIPPYWKEKFHRRILNRYCSIYYSLADKAQTAEDKRVNTEKLNSYRDSIISMAQPRSTDYWLNTASRQLNAGDHNGCLASLDSLETISTCEVDSGVLAHIRAQGLEAAGDTQMAKYHYAIAAAYDLRHSVRKYEALQELARILSAEGDNRRAFTYIMRAINDIHASHATSRIERISGYMPIISAAYANQQQKTTENKNMLLATSAILLIGLCLATFYAIRKNRHLNTEHRYLLQKNEELQRLRSSLSEANAKLKESSKVKEEYLGTLFNLCADYIDTFDKFRLQISQRLKAGKVKDINAALVAPVGADLLQSFFQKFDSIFLDIFPDFIDKFNTLMKPDHQLRPRPGELLSPELRIYALVRLGITDSTKIAAFLHYSPQTVYNYRFRVRSNARIPKEEFPLAVRAL